MAVTPTRIYEPFPELKLAAMGGFSRTPTVEATLARMGMPDPSASLCKDSEIKLITVAPSIAMLSQFCREHYGVTAVFEFISEIPDATGVHVYRLRS